MRAHFFPLVRIVAVFHAFLACVTTCFAVPKTIVVSGSGGDYRTVQAAIAAVPDNGAERTIIHIKAGTYAGPFVVSPAKTNVTLEGDSPNKTILTYDKNVRDPRPEGAHIFNPNLNVMGSGFRAENLTLQNTSGDHGQALAVRIAGERFVFTNCRLLGWQDTLLLDKGRYYFKNCYIEGRVDFIYGEGTSVFDTCEIHSKNGGYITAASTKPEVPFGFVFLHCKLTGDARPWRDAAGKVPARPFEPYTGALAYLGRPWRPFGNVAFIDCEIGKHIASAGWDNWGDPANEKTARCAEYGSWTPDGKRIDLGVRVPWVKKLTSGEALRYRDISAVLGGWDPTISGDNEREERS
jgi:pectinesterase